MRVLSISDTSALNANLSRYCTYIEIIHKRRYLLQIGAEPDPKGTEPIWSLGLLGLEGRPTGVPSNQDTMYR